MKLAIMQPYFFPYLGYFSLIKHTDQFIIFDLGHFIRHGWIERNRILKQNEGWVYFSVPVHKYNRETIIQDIRVDNSQNWKGKLLSQIEIYRKSANNYFKVRKLLTNLLDNDYPDIVSLNKAGLTAVCNYLNIGATFKVLSEMNLSFEKPNASDEWALNICKAIGNIDEYWNLQGGKKFFNKEKYDKCNIELRFHKLNLEAYNQKRTAFEPGLSIIDVMMFNTVEEINQMLDKYEFI